MNKLGTKHENLDYKVYKNHLDEITFGRMASLLPEKERELNWNERG